MPQADRHKNRTVYVEFIPHEDVSHLPHPHRYTLTVLTDGAVTGTLGGRPISLSAPAVLCLRWDDALELSAPQSVSAQSFCFHPDFLDTVTFSETQGYLTARQRITTGLALFQRDGPHYGIPHITQSAYAQLFEWFFILGTEVYAQSDSRWVCRIKKYLIQILGMLEDLNLQGEPSPVDQVLEYIHTNYAGKILLDDLTGCAHLNRVSLNQQFQQRCGCTAMGYLQSHRIKVAEDLLTHTGMTLDEIARSTGFAYDTYFIKQFTAKRGMTPTAFRNASREFAGAQ